jgi:hypothetical protein
VTALSVTASADAGHQSARERAQMPGYIHAELEAASRALHATRGVWIGSVGPQVISNPPVGPRAAVASTDLWGPPLDSGRYAITAYCVGVGHILVKLSSGDMTSQATASCHTIPQAIRIHVNVRKGGSLMIQFSALQRKAVAVTYRLYSAQI